MKIELKEVVDWDGTWYKIYVKDIIERCFRDEVEANIEYAKIVEASKKPAVVTVLKSEEV